jgi:hypothetical protein
MLPPFSTGRQKLAVPLPQDRSPGPVYHLEFLASTPGTYLLIDKAESTIPRIAVSLSAVYGHTRQREYLKSCHELWKHYK